MSARPTATTSDEGVTNTDYGRWMALSGLLFAALLIVGSLASMGSPSGSASAATVQTWYLDHKGRMNLSALATLLAVVVGLYFLNYVRSCFRRLEAEGWRSSLFWAGAVLFAVSGLIGAGVSATLGDSPEVLTPASLQLLNALATDLNYPAVAAALAVMFLGAGLAIRKTHVLPQWLAWVSWLFALCGASFILGFVALLGSALWVIAVAVILAVGGVRPQGA